MIEYDFSNTRLNNNELKLMKQLKRKSCPYQEQYRQLMQNRLIDVEVSITSDSTGSAIPSYGNMHISEKGLAFMAYRKEVRLSKIKSTTFDIINLIIALVGVTIAVISLILQ